ncbi:MAG: ComEC/Rec2-related protein [Alphaproteobacteria bacterium]|nr:ComEC/Rec2-related protein [Alphaproteobacteria bacterium]
MDILDPADRTLRDPQPADNLILWLPVFLCCGMGLYFGLSFEPPPAWLRGGFGLAVLGTAASFGWRNFAPWRWIAAFCIVFTLGLVLAQWRTHSVETKLLDERVWNADVAGAIESFERAGKGWRVVLKDTAVNAGADRYVLRLAIRQAGFSPNVGGMLGVKASLMPPSSPLAPGSYDFRRHAYFDGMGGYGYVTKIIDYKAPAQQAERNALENYRDWLTEKVYAALEQPEAGIVTALLNGQRAGIERKTTGILQQSGLQHVISISGLHVGLMAMTVFFVTRLLMACSMTLALNWPIKKIAAFLALLSIIFYLLIVGNSPPTLRSVLMSGMALIAVMLDREPIQMRVVALSALLILLIQPESVTDIGFQMSFAAVIGLVAFYQQTKAFWTHAAWQNSLAMKALRVLLITVVTSMIATLVTAPLVLLYFQQIPLLSMLANLLAMPPITFLIMPGTFLSYLFTPVPIIGDLAIRMMGLGVTMMMGVAEFVAHLPSAVWHAPPLPLATVFVMLLGVYAVIVIKNRWRWSGVGLVALGFMLAPLFARPDLLVTEGRVILQPDRNSDTLFVAGKLGGFEKNLLLQWTGKKTVQDFPCAGMSAGMICDREINGKKVRLILDVPSLQLACKEKADVVVTRFYLDRPCRDTLVIDRHDLERTGGQALFLQDAIRVQTVLEKNRRRPWQRRAATNRQFDKGALNWRKTPQERDDHVERSKTRYRPH